MPKLSIKVDGFNKMISQFRKFGDEGEKVIKEITIIKAQEIEAEAKRLAPVDLGKLRQEIKTEKISDTHRRVIAFAPYSAYMEFGTGDLVDIPEEFKEIASQFKGKGIRKINIKPQPFMYPAFVKAGKTYKKDLEKGLERLTKNFNG